ncbi:MAG TPA: diguanylate cyclase [Pseudomonas sp.]|nr:diguanylate cyclase [Pseudomonas sp.]
MTDGVVLCVDDDIALLGALRTLLSKQLDAGQLVEIAESGEEALEISEDMRAQGLELSVVISDFIMPGMRGDELLVRLHERHPDTIKILLTGQSDIEGVKRAINEANLYRFLEKPFDNTDIVLTAQSALRAFRQDRELQGQNERLKQINTELEALVEARTHALLEKNQELQRLAVTDCLTGLYNRLKLDQVLEEELSRSQRYATPFALLLLDLDHFKAINDQHGHQAGDLMLQQIASILGENARTTDAVGRWGGEEFLLVCRNTDLDGAGTLAEKLRQKIATHDFPRLGQRTASFGVAAYRQDDSITEMLARADTALYLAKDRGRNRVECSA